MSLSLEPKHEYLLKHMNEMCQVLPDEIVERCQEFGVTTVTEFMSLTVEETMNQLELTKIYALQLRSEIFAIFRPLITSPIESLYSMKPPLPTGIKKLDKVLEGGLYGGEVLEIHGPSGTGKSQLCMVIAASVCRNPESRVVYIDSKNDFNAIRFYNLCERSLVKVGQLSLLRETKMQHLIDIIEEYEIIMNSNQIRVWETFRVLIIDSLPMSVYPCMDDDDDASRLSQERLVQAFTRFAVRNSISVIIINHTVTDQKGSREPRTRYNSTTSNNNKNSVINGGGEKWKPALGQYWMSVPNFRLFVNNNKNNPRVFEATLEKSSRTPINQKFEFKITLKGIE